MIASCIHPREFANIIFGLIFFLMIPSTYVFLTLYSLINLNVINWGTREAVAQATGTTVHKENWLKKLGVEDENSVISRIFVCCSKPSVDVQISEHEAIRAMERRFERTERQIANLKGESPTLSRTKIHQNMLNMIADAENGEQLNDVNFHSKIFLNFVFRDTQFVDWMKSHWAKQLMTMQQAKFTKHAQNGWTPNICKVASAVF